MSAKKPGTSTQAVHAGEPRQKAFDALATPISQTATYSFADTAELKDYFEGNRERQEYGRYGNPTVDEVEQKLAALDRAPSAVGFASGMAAITTSLFALLKSGDHVVLSDDGYRRSRQFVRMLGAYGVAHEMARAADPEHLARVVVPGKTKVILVETPTNPHLRVADLAAYAKVAEAAKAKLLVDSTFATPVNQRPLEQGAHLVIHSATKYLGGHNDLLAGVVCGPAGLCSVIRDARGVMGGVMDPHAAYLLLRGVKTLALRVERQNRNGLAIAQLLEGHPKVERVFYPGLPSHPDHQTASRLMAGYGGVVSFVLRGGLEAGTRLVDAARLPKIAASLGGVESLIEQPALMSFYELTPAQRGEIGIEEGLVRYAAGIEDTEDLLADLTAALEQT